MSSNSFRELLTSGKGNYFNAQQIEADVVSDKNVKTLTNAKVLRKSHDDSDKKTDLWNNKLVDFMDNVDSKVMSVASMTEKILPVASLLNSEFEMTGGAASQAQSTVSKILPQAADILGKVYNVHKLYDMLAHNNPVLLHSNSRSDSGMRAAIDRLADKGKNLGTFLNNKVNDKIGLEDPDTMRDYTNINGSTTTIGPPLKIMSDPSVQPVDGNKLTATTGKVLRKMFSLALKTLGKNETSFKQGTLFVNPDRMINTILSKSDMEIGLAAESVLTKDKQDKELYGMDPSRKFNKSNEAFDYYKDTNNPFYRSDGSDKGINSPLDSLKYASTYYGFTKGYSDIKGITMGSSHLWGIRIAPYGSDSYPINITTEDKIFKESKCKTIEEFKHKMTTPITPPLPVVLTPTWQNVSTDPDNIELKMVYKEFDYGLCPPVMGYSLNFGTSREKEIELYNNGKFSLPMGFSFSNVLSIDFVDDENLSLKKYFNMYFNRICIPGKALMASYDRAAFMITLSVLKPGLKVNFMYKFICLPINYGLNLDGTSDPGSGASVKIDFSIIGMLPPNNFNGPMDNLPTSNASSGARLWYSSTWEDIFLQPMGTKYESEPKKEEPKKEESSVFTKVYGDQITDDIVVTPDTSNDKPETVYNGSLGSYSQNQKINTNGLDATNSGIPNSGVF